MNIEAPPTDSLLNRLCTTAAIAARVGILLVLALIGLMTLIMGIAWQDVPTTVLIIVGIAFLLMAFFSGKTTWALIKQRKSVSLSDKIVAIPLLGGMGFTALFLCMCLPYLSRPFKQQLATQAIMKEKIPSYKGWDSLGMEQKKKELPALIGLLAHENRGVRQSAAYCIGSIGEQAVGAIPALTKMLEEDQTIPSAAATALAQLGPLGREALKNELQHPNRFTRESAQFALK